MIRRAQAAAKRRRRGAATMEFALVIPPLLLVFVGILDFARVFRHDLRLLQAARAAALFECDPRIFEKAPWDDPVEAALAACSGIDPLPSISIVRGADSTGLEYVEVTASATFRSLTRLPGLPDDLAMSRSVRMQKRQHFVTPN